ncbi:MAG: hypothetical protein E5W55_00445 [Mesorhizobium sp.]|nr:MAG: hypothetical protein E5W55_00445 [Mesorhizobium sp.]
MGAATSCTTSYLSFSSDRTASADIRILVHSASSPSMEFEEIDLHQRGRTENIASFKVKPASFQEAAMADNIEKLVRECNQSRSKGADFPTIWQTMLKGHSYVSGPPVQDRDEHGPLLSIPLITGRHILFGGSGFRAD